MIKKTVLTLAAVLLGALLLACIGFFALYFTRIRTVSSIQKITDYEDGYDLYSMTVKYDYDLDAILDSGYTDMQGFIDAVIKEPLPLLPVKINVPSFGCNVFRAKTEDGNVLMGRNYDFKLDTSVLAVICDPKDGYRSVSFAALNNISADHADESIVKKMACLTAPFIGLDGVNEKGVSVAVLTVPSEPTMHNTGKPKLATSLLIRLVLDRAATTEEAIELIKQYDIFSTNGIDYHFIISDASGNSVAVEFDCESENREMVVTPTEAISNFYVMYVDKTDPDSKKRYNEMMDILRVKGGVVDRKTAWGIMKTVAKGPETSDSSSNTQWSVLFDNTNGTAEIITRRHWGDSYTFTLDE